MASISFPVCAAWLLSAFLLDQTSKLTWRASSSVLRQLFGKYWNGGIDHEQLSLFEPPELCFVCDLSCVVSFFAGLRNRHLLQLPVLSPRKDLW